MSFEQTPAMWVLFLIDEDRAGLSQANLRRRMKSHALKKSFSQALYPNNRTVDEWFDSRRSNRPQSEYLHSYCG